jgi:hypothetical protein
VRNKITYLENAASHDFNMISNPTRSSTLIGRLLGDLPVEGELLVLALVGVMIFTLGAIYGRISAPHEPAGAGSAAEQQVYGRYGHVLPAAGDLQGSQQNNDR